MTGKADSFPTFAWHTFNLAYTPLPTNDIKSELPVSPKIEMNKWSRIVLRITVKFDPHLNNQVAFKDILVLVLVWSKEYCSTDR